MTGKRKIFALFCGAVLFFVIFVLEADIFWGLKDDSVNRNSIITGQMEDGNIDDVMNIRKRRLSEICRKFAGEVPKPRFTNLRLIRGNSSQSQLVWCPVYKAGTTFWHNRLTNLYGDIVEASNKSDVLTQKGSCQHALIVVRHPFDRLVSAFRDKLERTHGRNTFFYRNYGSRMVTRYREKAIAALGKEYFSRNNGAPLPGLATNPFFWFFVLPLQGGYCFLFLPVTPSSSSKSPSRASTAPLVLYCFRNF